MSVDRSSDGKLETHIAVTSCYTDLNERLCDIFKKQEMLIKILVLVRNARGRGLDQEERSKGKGEGLGVMYREMRHQGIRQNVEVYGVDENGRWWKELGKG